ncbi:MAG: ATP-dependent sacrificial sulfur transferase LarE [Planctomycetota bacterium]|nr:ATP-dependent sacrificial sulfur transferase LarE [Planctomycetota bacterium]MDP6763840.1 ATP-dependent sacrificial sulfur transferase LarE [Planctomycetota bacterium]MDP6988828.1 ATP-dependent sacrificial sulfur transferase LarE [Planctomycetota bacterium]
MSAAPAGSTEALYARLSELESVAVAFSGGVDSSVLLHAAHTTLRERAAAVVADSPSLPRSELEGARAFARELGARLAVLRPDELADPRYRANGADRCYHCKSALFRVALPWALANGFAVVAVGEITDDLLDDRPGSRAASEAGVVAPLREAGLSKADVRRYAREAGLAVADKPASACLASRLPRGRAVSAERLARVERAEERLRELGLRALRVRDHGAWARVEVGADELDHAAERRASIGRALAGCGFDAFELAAYVPPAERSRARA